MISEKIPSQDTCKVFMWVISWRNHTLSKKFVFLHIIGQ